MTRQIKTCNCCNTKAHSLRQRVCRVCRVPAIWTKREEAKAEADERKAKQSKLENTLTKLLAKCSA